MKSAKTGSTTDPKAESVAQTRRISAFSSLRHKNYLLLWIGNIFTNMAFWLQLITLGWLVWELTKDPETGRGSVFLSSAAAGLRALPFLIVGPWAGVMVDRLDRRKFVIIIHVLLAISGISFALFVTSALVEVWHAFIYASVSGICYAALQPARQALIVNTVPPQELGNAIALNAMAVTANRLIGATLGGLLITTVGIQWNFFVEGGAYIVMAILLLPMKTPYQEKQTTRSFSVLTNLRQGVAYIWNDNRIILHLIVLSLILNLFFMPIPSLLPAYTGQVLHEEADVGGFLMATQGAGGMTATIVIASLGFIFRKGPVGLIALVVGSVAILAMAQSHWLLLSLAMMALLGFSQTVFIVGNQTLVQTMVPDTLRGRVTSLYMLEYGLGPLSVFLIGAFMDLFSVASTLTVMAFVSLGLSLFFLITFKKVRQLD